MNESKINAGEKETYRKRGHGLASRKAWGRKGGGRGRRDEGEGEERQGRDRGEGIAPEA